VTVSVVAWVAEQVAVEQVPAWPDAMVPVTV
jgi:hypothetical protein